MSQSAPIEAYEQGSNTVTGRLEQSKGFLARTREYPADGDLHQASEKGCSGAPWMAKAVGTAQRYEGKIPI
jgi:hypothetical protein